MDKFLAAAFSKPCTFFTLFFTKALERLYRMLHGMNFPEFALRNSSTLPLFQKLNRIFRIDLRFVDFHVKSVAQLDSRYNFPMPMTAQDLLESARQLPTEDRQALLLGLLNEEESEWRKELGSPDPEHSEWLATRVRKSLENTRRAISTEEAMSRARSAINKATAIKQSA